MNGEPQKTGEEMVRDKKGRFVEGHEKMGGRPKGSISLTSMAKRMLEEIPTGERMTRAEAFLRRVFIMAINGSNEQMIKLVWNYVEGMPKESVEMKGEIEHKENKIIDLLKDADEKTRKKVIDGFIEILRSRGDRDSISK